MMSGKLESKRHVASYKVVRIWLQAQALLKHFVAPALHSRCRSVPFIDAVLAKVCGKWNLPVKQAPLAANVKDAMISVIL